VYVERYVEEPRHFDRYHVRIEAESRYIIRTLGGRAAGGGQVLRAPMPGKVVVVEVSVSQVLAPGGWARHPRGDDELRAAVAGTVKEIRVEAGQAVNPGDTWCWSGMAGCRRPSS
jgi:biotin carboxyl carrier protein